MVGHLARPRDVAVPEALITSQDGDLAAVSGSRMTVGGYLNFAIERNYDVEAQIMGMELEGIDIAVMFPTMGLSLIARDKIGTRISRWRFVRLTTTGSTSSRSIARTNWSGRRCCRCRM